MNNSTIFSIGHGTKKIEHFIEELKSFGISYLVDVRSKPFSKYNPQFNQGVLQMELKNNGIKYVFLGDKLGGLPADDTCYHDGKVDYDLVKEKDFFKEGLRRLITANTKGVKLAIMCSESKPEACHRSKLIGQELLRDHISIKHIIAKSKAKDQMNVINEVTKGKNAIDLFGNETNFTSRKLYT